MEWRNATRRLFLVAPYLTILANGFNESERVRGRRIMSRFLSLDDTAVHRTRVLFREHQDRIFKRTDHLFAGLLLFQWCVSIGAAYWLSPLTWVGSYSQTHL